MTVITHESRLNQSWVTKRSIFKFLTKLVISHFDFFLCVMNCFEVTGDELFDIL